jgi:SnoaL-like domain
VTGRAAIAAWLESRGHSPAGHRVDLCVCDGDGALVEGSVVAAGRDVAGFAGSIRLDASGRIARYLVFAGRPAPRPALADLAPVARPADAFAVFDSYLTALQDARIDDAVAHFSDDALYSHPPYVHRSDDGRLEFRGRAAIAAGFASRGPSPFRHDVLVGGQRGAHAIVEARTRDLPGGRAPGSFISILSLDDEARIRRYVSYYTEPAVP